MHVLPVIKNCSHVFSSCFPGHKSFAYDVIWCLKRKIAGVSMHISVVMSKSTRETDFLKRLLYDGCAFEESDGSDVEESNPLKKAREISIDENDDGVVTGLHPSNGTEQSLTQNGLVTENKDATGNKERETDFVEKNAKSFEDVVAELGWQKLEESKMKTMEFDSSVVAYYFYNDYAKMIGFSVRKDRYTKSKGVAIRRNFVCSCEGLRDVKYSKLEGRIREPRRITRTDCHARFEVKLLKSGKWAVSKFVGEHNHKLAPNQSSMFLRSHRKLSDEDKDMVKSLYKSGLRKCQIMDYLVYRAGGFFEVGFLARDMRNFLHRDKVEEYSYGDTKTLLLHMAKKTESDPSYYYQHDTNKDGQLTRLFWADSKARKDYVFFGDVLLFDATYRTNQYKMSFVTFAGVNNHHQTVIFGFSLMTSETDDAYLWALRAFIDAMGGRHPKSVITDDDSAIRNAVEELLPTSRHRLCSWHLAHNCASNIHNTGFVVQFHALMHKNCSVEEFDKKWEKLVETFELQNNNWVVMVYKKRERWAEAYLRDGFFGGCRSNQRCESLNSMVRHHVKSGMRIFELYHRMEWAVEKMRHHVKSGMRIFELYHRMEWAVEKMRHREHEAEIVTSVSRPFIDSHLIDIANHAASVYTKASFDVFKKQLGMEAWYIIEGLPEEDDSHNLKFTLNRYKGGNRKWCVQYHADDEMVNCSCGLLQSYGFPCGHMIAVLKHQHVDRLPSSCIVNRWTRHVKSVIPNGNRPFIPNSLQASLRQSELMNETKKLCLWGSESNEKCEEVKNLVSSFLKLKDSPLGSESNSLHEEVDINMSDAQFDFIKDPPKTNSKGRPPSKRIKGHYEQKSKNCSHCHLPGHTHPTCPNRKAKIGGPSINHQHLKECDRRAEVDNDVLVDHEFPSPRPGMESHTVVEPEVMDKGLKKKNKCGLCGIPGHNRKKCSQLSEQYLAHFAAGSNQIAWWIMENRREYFDRAKPLLSRVKMLIFLSESQSKQWLNWSEQEGIKLDSPGLVPLSVNDELAFVAGLPCSLNTPSFTVEKMLERRLSLRNAVREEMGLTDNDMLVMSLSSINPGKGQLLLLEAAHLAAKGGLALEGSKIKIKEENTTGVQKDQSTLSKNKQPSESVKSSGILKNPKKKASRLSRLLSHRNHSKSMTIGSTSNMRKLLSDNGEAQNHTFRVLIGSVGSKSNKVPYVKGLLRFLSEHPELSKVVLWSPATTHVASLYSAADVYIINSQGVGETFGRVTVEAMAFGLPVLGTDAGGTQEIVEHNITGLLHPVGRPGTEALAKNLLFLLHNPAQREQMGIEGRRKVEKMYLKQHTYKQFAWALIKCLRIK